MPQPATKPTSSDVFALLDHVLSSARLKLRREAKPIGFEMLPSGETWMFDPKAEGPLFARSVIASTPGLLRVRCRPELLARLVTDPAFELGEDDEASFEGEIEDLLGLVSAFEQAGNAIGIRSTRKPR